MTLQERITARLRELGKTASEVERAAKLPRGMISDVVGGRKESVRAATVSRIAAALGVDPNDLVADQRGMTEPQGRFVRADEQRRSVWQLLAPTAKTPAARGLFQGLRQSNKVAVVQMY